MFTLIITYYLQIQYLLKNILYINDLQYLHVTLFTLYLFTIFTKPILYLWLSLYSGTCVMEPLQTGITSYRSYI
jgi:hypothetical protein